MKQLIIAGLFLSFGGIPSSYPDQCRRAAAGAQRTFQHDSHNQPEGSVADCDPARWPDVDYRKKSVAYNL